MSLFSIGSSDPVILEFRPSTLELSNFAHFISFLWDERPNLSRLNPMPPRFWMTYKAGGHRLPQQWEHSIPYRWMSN
jgi:hypothetical protein